MKLWSVDDYELVIFSRYEVLGLCIPFIGLRFIGIVMLTQNSLTLFGSMPITRKDKSV